MVVTITVIVVIIGVGVGILAFRFRTEKGIESGITSFRRELHALAPRPGQRDAAPTDRPAADPRGVTIVPDESDADASDDEGDLEVAVGETEPIDDTDDAAPDDAAPDEPTPPDTGTPDAPTPPDEPAPAVGTDSDSPDEGPDENSDAVTTNDADDDRPDT